MKSVKIVMLILSLSLGLMPLVAQVPANMNTAWQASVTAQYLQGLGQTPTFIVVGAGGAHATIRAAVAALPKGTGRVVLVVQPGQYNEKITIDRPNVSIWGGGANASATTITFDDAAGNANGSKTFGPSDAATVIITSTSTDFTAENVTFANHFDPKTPKGGISKDFQAPAVRSDGDRSLFFNVRFSSFQQTLFLRNNARVIVANSYIEGDDNFIIGRAQAYFVNNQIQSRVRPLGQNAGYITAANTEKDDRSVNYFGFVIVNSRLTHEAGLVAGSVWLGRPWRANANVVYMNTEMAAHIRAAGWTSMSGGGQVNEPANARFFEYNNSGPGSVANPVRRLLTASQAREYSPEKVLGANSGLYNSAWISWQSVVGRFK